MTEEKQQSKLDLVFVVDCTSSMSSYIKSAQENIVKIIEAIQASEKVDVQFGLISYRDHPPQDSTYITKKYDFTNSVSTAQKNVNSMRAEGGGDTPEAVCCGLHEALNLEYREGAVKIAIFVSDAPPHGLHDSLGDEFPNGCPDRRDPMRIAKEMLEKEIIVYCIGCEPALSGYAFVKQWFCAIAQITGGRYVSLSDAQSLPQVIIYGAEEEMRLEQLADQMLQEEILIKKEYESEGKEIPAMNQMSDLVASRLAQKGVQLNTMSAELGKLTEEQQTLVNLMSDISTMAEVKEFLKTQKLPAVASTYAARTGGGGGAVRVKTKEKRSSRKAEVNEDCDDDFGGVLPEVELGAGVETEEKAEFELVKSESKKSSKMPSLSSVPRPVRSAAAPAAALSSVSAAPPAAKSMQSKEVRQEMSSISSTQVQRVMHRKKKM